MTEPSLQNADDINKDNFNNSNKNKPPYWGFFATIGFGILIFTLYGLAQAAIIFGAAFNNGMLTLDLLTSGDKYEMEKTLKDITLNGDLLGLTGIPSIFIGVGLVLLIVKLRQTLSIRDYLDLRVPQQPIKTVLKWIGVMFLLFIAMEVIVQLIDHTPPEFMSRVYGSTNNKIMLWITVVLAAPLFEEFFFRGFLLEGLRHFKLGFFRLGDIGAVLLTSFLFAITHVQYGLFEITYIFVVGIIFAVAKLKTNSLYVPIAMHIFMNLSASVLMEIAPELAK